MTAVLLRCAIKLTSSQLYVIESIASFHHEFDALDKLSVSTLAQLANSWDYHRYW